MAEWSLPREDQSLRQTEGFRPPPHERAVGVLGGLKLALRRFADLQFGSIWRDLAILLPQVRGPLADIGCGAQPFRDLLDPGVQYIGVDIAEAGTRFGYSNADTRYFTGATLPLADGEANALLCTETLEHVLVPQAFLRELRRVLAVRGRLILTVPFAARWHFVPHDYWRYTPSGLAQLLAEAGFEEVRIYPRGGALCVASYKVLGTVLLLLAGRRRTVAASVVSRLLGLALLPLAALSAVLGNVGLRYPGTAEDTIGYTVLARKGSPS